MIFSSMIPKEVAFADVQSDRARYEEYSKKSAKEFNTMLVNLHNAYKQGEKQYGYTYTLERAKQKG